MHNRYSRARLGKAQAIIAIISLVASFFSGFATPQVWAQTSVFINEIHYDNSGTDAGEAIEVAGPSGTDLTGWSIVLYNGNGGAVYDTTVLSGTIPDQQGGFGTVSVSYPVNGIQNGAPDGIALVDAGSAVVQFLSYEGVFTAADGPASGMTSTDIGVSESSSTAVGDSLQLAGEGASYEDFAWASPTPNTFGAVNTGQTFSVSSVPDVIINEVDSDTPSTDVLEFVELYDGGSGNTALDGLVVVFYNGNGDVSYNSFDLDGYTTDGDGYFLMGNAGVVPAPAIVFPSNGLQNGADAVAIYAGDATDFPSGTALTTDSLIDAIVYDTNDADDAGLLVLLNPGQPQVDEGGGGDKDNHSNQRCPNGTGGALNTDTYIQNTPTPGAANNCPLPVPDVIINEVDSDTPSTDVLEFVELYDGGSGNTALDGLVVVFYNGNGDVSYNSFDLDGYTTDVDGYFLMGNAGVVPMPAVVFPSNGLQNGADAVAIYVGDATDFPSGTALTTDSLIDAVVYDTNDADDAGLLVLLNPGQPQVDEDGGGDKDNHSNQRCPNGAGGARNTDTYVQRSPTPGAANDCPAPFTSIYDIQYTTDPSGDSPFKGQSGITTEGIVTAIFSDGYFVEDPAGGAWNGLFVYDWHGPALGDLVRMTGTVDEFYGLTEMNNLTGYAVLSSGNSLPAPVVLPTGDVSQEQWEGVLVRVENVTVTADSLGYGEWSVSDGSGDVVIDDKGSYTYAPTIGDTIVSIVGPLDYGYGAFKIQPRDDLDIFVCGGPATAIHYIQGSGSTSPEVGNAHAIEGVVVGDFQTGAHLRGFFIQEEDANADADPLTSEGLFVYDGSYPALDVNVGDVVRVQGTVAEYYGLTELSFVSDIAVCGSGAATAAIAMLPVSSLDEWEQYEGMLIHIPQTLYATDNYNQGRYGEVTLSVSDRQYNPTSVVPPGAPAIALQAQNDLSRIQLDDGSTAENPSPAPYIGLDNTLRAGDTIPELTGVLGYAYGVYEVHPTGAVSFARVNGRDATPDPVGGVVRIASFNVLNYFTTLDDSGPICGPTGGMDCRGADNAFEFTRQRDKIIAAIVTMDADVIGLMELENHPTDAALQDLVNGLNDAAGPGTYDYIGTGPIGTDAIKLAFIYKPGSVTPVGSYVILDSTVDPTFIDTRNRPALAQTFVENGTGEVFTVVVNHLKSKSSPCDDIGDPDTGDGQGNCNLTRTSAANAIVNWLATDPTGSGDSDFLIIGDLNAYAMEDPIAAITAGGYTNLIETFVGLDAYSYVYYGQAGYLDHALASPGLTVRVSGVTEWHINADEPSALDYNNYNQAELYNPDQYRASDHDPVIVGFSFQPPVAAFTPSASNIFDDETVTFVNESTGDEPQGYLWDFGDGNTSTEHSPTYGWADPGYYTVTLTVSHDQASDSASVGILVRPRTVPFETFAIQHATVHWSRRDGGLANFTALGRLELPEGYSRANLTRDLELVLTIGGESAADAVSMTEHGQVWVFQRRLDPALDGLQLTGATVIWPKEGKPWSPLLILSGAVSLPGVDHRTRPAEATVELSLPVLGDQLAERVVGEETIAFRPLHRVWVYRSW